MYTSNWNLIFIFQSLANQGGSEARAKAARRIVDGGVAVMGHVGLTPQAIRYVTRDCRRHFHDIGLKIPFS